MLGAEHPVWQTEQNREIVGILVRHNQIETAIAVGVGQGKGDGACTNAIAGREREGAVATALQDCDLVELEVGHGQVLLAVTVEVGRHDRERHGGRLISPDAVASGWTERPIPETKENLHPSDLRGEGAPAARIRHGQVLTPITVEVPDSHPCGRDANGVAMSFAETSVTISEVDRNTS